MRLEGAHLIPAWRDREGELSLLDEVLPKRAEVVVRLDGPAPEEEQVLCTAGPEVTSMISRRTSEVGRCGEQTDLLRRFGRAPPSARGRGRHPFPVQP